MNGVSTLEDLQRTYIQTTHFLRIHVVSTLEDNFEGPKDTNNKFVDLQILSKLLQTHFGVQKVQSNNNT